VHTRLRRIAMKIEIELKRGTARRMGLVASTVAVLGVAAAVYANQVHFSSGQTLTAADLNSNFDELYAAAAKPTITKNGKSISIGGTYCGASAGPYNGAEVGGYTGAKAKCETKCASATAHICDGAEMVRSEQLGLALPNGAWLASFASSTRLAWCGISHHRSSSRLIATRRTRSPAATRRLCPGWPDIITGQALLVCITDCRASC
jgi:hypothetical protein